MTDRRDKRPYRPDTISLDLWVTMEIQLLKDFREYWSNEQIGKNCQDYPNELTLGEWDEQFRIFYI